MKFCSILTISICALLALCAYADEHEVESSILEVSLFRDGALVTRQGTLNVPSGKSTLVFKNLPSQVDPTALQANFVNTANGLIRNAKIFQPQNRDENSIIDKIQTRLSAAKKEKEQKLRTLSNAKADVVFASGMRASFAEEFGKINEGQTLTLAQAKELAEFVGQTQKLSLIHI